MKLTDQEKALILAGFVNGYECGHNDTVESGYTDAKERAKDWLNDALDDGGLEYSIEQIKKGEL